MNIISILQSKYVLGGIAIFAVALIVWIYGQMKYNEGYKDKDIEWVKAIATAPVKTTVEKETLWLPSPPVKGSAQAHPIPDPDRKYRRIADSLITHADSLSELVAELLIPRSTTIVDTLLGTLQMTYTPIDKRFDYDWRPLPAKVVRETVTVEKLVPIEKKRPWWEIPAAVVVGGTAGYLVAREIND